ncbi:MAG: hypothetical protein GWO86_00275 [Planctomycetes bacterium]|nr:hypothetical protein [Planctomycetota bacterium]
MITERYHRPLRRIRGIATLALTVCVLLVNIQLCRGGDNTANTSAVRARIFTLNNISAQEGREYLKKLAIGETVLPIPGTRAMSVTGNSLELVRAATVLNLVDSEEKYLIKKIALKDTDSIPGYEELSRKLVPAISIGSLISRPGGKSAARAIVDRRGDELVIVATRQRLPEIIRAIEHFQNEDIAAAAASQAINVPVPAERQAGQQSKNIVADVNRLLPEMTITEQTGRNNPAPPPDNNAYQKMLIPNGDDPVNIDLPEKLEIVQLIDIVGKLLNLDYLYDETKVKGNVTVKIQGKMRVRDLYELLENVLKFKGLVMSRSGNLVTIVPTANALDTDPVFSAGGIRPGDVVVTRIFRLNYITTAAAKKTLTEMKLGANINEIPESGTLIITEFAFRMGRIERLLQLVDVPGEARIFRLRELKYTLVTSLVPKLQEMAGRLGAISITVAKKATPAKPVRSRRARAAKPAKPSQTATTIQKSEVYIDYDERTNRVLMIGRKGELAMVEELIDALDVPQQDLRMLHEYKIKYVGIEDVVDALTELNIIGGSKKIKTGGGPPVKKGSAAATALLRGVDEPQVVQMESANSLLVNATPEQHIRIAQIVSYVDREADKISIPYRIYRLENQEPDDLADVLNNLIEKTIKDPKGKIQKKITREEDIAIIADQKTFSIIVYASKKNQEWIGELIKALDIRRPQVLIDVSLVEITRNDQFTYDLNLLANARRAVTDSTGLAGTVMTAVTGDILEGGYDKKLSGFYSSDNIQALLTMITTKGYGRVLAQPKILVNDSEEGTIETNQKTYISEETQSFPTTSTNGGTPIPVKSITWKDYNAKINLTITPQISEGDLLRLTIKMVREDFGKGETGAPPDLTTSNVNTVVTVPDGSTIILGGLNKLNQNKSGSKIPFLGDIPLAGGLFRSVDNSNIEKRLYIFVKANILRPDTEEGMNPLREISRKNKAAFEKAEDDFQKHKDFPGIEPTVFEPRRVLEQMDGDANVRHKKPAETGSVELETVKPAETDSEVIDSLELLQGQQ